MATTDEKLDEAITLLKSGEFCHRMPCVFCAAGYLTAHNPGCRLDKLLKSAEAKEKA